MTDPISLGKVKKYDLTADPYLQFEQNQRIQSAAAHALITSAAIVTAALVITACVTPLSGSAIGLFAASIVIAFVAGVFFLPDHSDYIPAYQPSSFDDSDRSTPWLLQGRTSPSSSLIRAVQEDPHKAKAAEILNFPKGIPNPCSNCFMNAALQALMINDDISDHILGQLDQISQDDTLNDHNTLQPASPAIMVPNLKNQPGPVHAVFEADILQRQDLLFAELIAGTQQLSVFQRLPSYTVDTLLASSRDKSYLTRLYLTCSTKEAAKISYDLLTKWKQNHLLTSNESVLLRVALIKLLGRKADVILVKNNSREEAKWRLPGLNTLDYSIFIESQDEAGNFARKLIENLDHISQRANPISATYERTAKGFRIPEDAGLSHFDETLAIPGAVKQNEYAQQGFNVLCNSQNQFRLDSPEIFSEFRTTHKAESLLEKAYECLPNTYVGETISEIISYQLQMPEKLFLHLQVSFDYVHKFEYVKTKFTNPEQFTITFPEQEFKPDEQTYKLKSFTVHTGRTINSGHYYTYSRRTREDGTDYWMKQNDSSVTAVNVDEVRQVLCGNKSYVSANMLIFERIHA